MTALLLEASLPPRKRTDNVSIGPRLKVIRERHGMTQEEVANRLGMSADGYRHREHGRSKMLSITELAPLADVYGITIPELLVELGYAPPTDQPPAERLDSMTPAHWRQWLVREYGQEIALVVTRALEGASQYDERDVRFLAANVENALDLLRRRERDQDS